MKIQRVLVAGVAGASLGTEVIKCLKYAGNYKIFVCDISNLAQGLYEPNLGGAFVVEESNYIRNIIDLCENQLIDFVIPGGEKPMVLLSNARLEFQKRGIGLALNNAETINICADKIICFKVLEEAGFAIPLSSDADNFEAKFPPDMPCVVKPATGSGGSSFVFLARNRNETTAYVDYLLRNGQVPIIQEYIADTDGEFTVGTLILGDKRGSIALKRSFCSKLSVSHRTDFGVISSGYSQGEIDDFPVVQRVSEGIALALGSTGPLNVQGRMRNGIFIPFEVNPRFSATVYLRTLAGWNEIDFFINYDIMKTVNFPKEIRSGFYLRSLTEEFVPRGDLK